MVFSELEMPHSWQEEFDKADALIERSDNDRARCLLYGTKSRNAHKIGQYDEALNYALNGLELGRKNRRRNSKNRFF